MQQRVALARLLMTGADILLLDEPFGALDEFTRERLNLELMRIVAEVKATTLFVTRNIGEAIFLADRVTVMRPRPGRLGRIADLNLPRRRDPSIQLTPALNALVEEVRDNPGSEGMSLDDDLDSVPVEKGQARRIVLNHLTILFALHALWEPLVRVGWMDELCHPLPSEIPTRFRRLFFVQGNVHPHLGLTRRAVVLGFLIGSAFGIARPCPSAWTSRCAAS